MSSKPLSDSTPIDVVRYLIQSDCDGVVFFDSGKSAQGKSLWSIIVCQPNSVLTEFDNRFIELPSGKNVRDVRAWMAEKGQTSPDVSSCQAPFQGGLAGFLGFELAWFLGGVNAERKPSTIPLLWVGEFDAAACYEHSSGTWFLTGDVNASATAALKEAIESAGNSSQLVPESGVALDYASKSEAKLSISPSEYEAQVAKCIDVIRAGELLQVNFTERFQADWDGRNAVDNFALFEVLRSHANGSYGGFLRTNVLNRLFSLASVSPEQFLAVEKRRVITRPIKGTRRRGATAAEDQTLRNELLTSVKDRGENQFIVDLMHEDLAKVCVAGSVTTSSFCALESFEGVHHLVSTVEGELSCECDALDAFLSCFPAGSCVGVPRDRAMEYIAALESSARGPYTGSMFYWSKDGRLDSNVLIRTAVLNESCAYYGAGGAVVLDSDPHNEYVEAELKARPFLITLNAGYRSE